MWTGATALGNSIMSYSAGQMLFGFNNAEGAAVVFTNTATTAYSYSVLMNNVTRTTYHNYTDGSIIENIGPRQTRRVFSNGNTIIGESLIDGGHKLEVDGDTFIVGTLEIDNVPSLATPAVSFIVRDNDLLKSRTASEVLTDIGGQSALLGTGLVKSTGGVISYITDNSTEWDEAYEAKINSAEVTGTVTKTLTMYRQDGGTITASWNDYDTAPVRSVFGRTGDIIALAGDYNTNLVTEATNLYFTDARSREAISLTTTGNSGASTYDSVSGIFNIPEYTLAGLGGVPETRALTINGVTYNLAINRSWSVGTVTSVGIAMPTGFVVNNSPINTSGDLQVSFDPAY